MITEATRRALEAKCKALCDAFALECAYFAQVLGPRRHYLAGYGEMKPEKPRQLLLSAHLALFWHGSLGREAEADVRTRLDGTVRRIERDLANEAAELPVPARHHHG